jgi:ketosteroid isomerase-like protein
LHLTAGRAQSRSIDLLMQEVATVLSFMIRPLIRRHISQLNAGNYQPLLKMAAPDAELRFPGENSWSGMFRAPGTGTAYSSTHRGTNELAAFAQRFVDNGLHIAIEDILVSGPPWNTRICVRATDNALGADGREVYANRVAILMEARWGRITRWEDYLDTERVSAWDRLVGAHEQTASAAAS